jgi:hypothetical protein
MKNKLLALVSLAVVIGFQNCDIIDEKIGGKPIITNIANKVIVGAPHTLRKIKIRADNIQEDVISIDIDRREINFISIPNQALTIDWNELDTLRNDLTLCAGDYTVNIDTSIPNACPTICPAPEYKTKYLLESNEIISDWHISNYSSEINVSNCEYHEGTATASNYDYLRYICNRSVNNRIIEITREIIDQLPPVYSLFSY